MNNETLKKLSREYLKSYYSINSYIGCSINCGYCFLAPIKIVPMRPVKAIDELELIEDMLADPLFVRDKTVLSLNNRTDPFISDEVKESTFTLLDIMESKGLRNIVTITTKGRLSSQDAVRLDEYKNINVVIIVTYNGLPMKMQPIAKENQEMTMKHIAETKNVLLLHQFRPIIPGLNDDAQTIEETVNFAKQYCKATIYQGIRVNKFIKDRLEEREYFYDGGFDSHKQKSKSVDDVFEMLAAQDLDYPIFDHTSCALSTLFGCSDYNMHYLKKSCSEQCINYNNCHAETAFDISMLDEHLNNIGVNSEWKYDNHTLHIDGNLNDEQKSYIKHILHVPVKAKNRENTFSEMIMEGKS